MFKNYKDEGQITGITVQHLSLIHIWIMNYRDMLAI